MACKTNRQCDFCDARCPEWYNNKIIHILNQIYDTYKGKVEEATSIWKSECCCISDDEDREIEDKKDLLYFEGLLQEIDNNFVPLEEN